MTRLFLEIFLLLHISSVNSPGIFNSPVVGRMEGRVVLYVLCCTDNWRVTVLVSKVLGRSTLLRLLWMSVEITREICAKFFASFQGYLTHLANDAAFEGSVPSFNVNLKLPFRKLLLIMLFKKTHMKLKQDRKHSLEIHTTTKHGNRLHGQLKYSLNVPCPRCKPYLHLAWLSTGSLTSVLFTSPTQFYISTQIHIFAEVNSRRRSKESVGLILGEHGHLSNRDEEKVVAFNAFSASVLSNTDRPGAA